MGDFVAEAAIAVLLAGVFNSVERHSDRPVARRMRLYRDAIMIKLRDKRLHLIRAENQQPVHSAITGMHRRVVLKHCSGS